MFIAAMCSQNSVYAQCGSVFINAFLQYSHVATLDVVRAVFGHTGATLCVCSIVCLMYSEEEDRIKLGDSRFL